MLIENHYKLGVLGASRPINRNVSEPLIPMFGLPTFDLIVTQFTSPQTGKAQFRGYVFNLRMSCHIRPTWKVDDH